MKYALKIIHGDITSNQENDTLETIRRTVWGLLQHDEIKGFATTGSNDYTEWRFDAPDPEILAGLVHVAETLAPEGWTITSTTNNWDR